MREINDVQLTVLEDIRSSLGEVVNILEGNNPILNKKSSKASPTPKGDDARKSAHEAIVTINKALANAGALNGKMTLSIQEYSGDPSTRVGYMYGYVAVMTLGTRGGEGLRLIGEGRFIYDALKALAKEIKGKGLDEFKI